MDIKEFAETIRWYLDNEFNEQGRKEMRALATKVIGDKEGRPAAVAPAPFDRKPAAKLAVVVGHNERAPGASALAPIDASEFAWNSKVAAAMVEIGREKGVEVRVFFRRKSTSYGAEIRAAYASVNEWGPDAVMELHFNATLGASGTETLYAKGREASRMLAQTVQRAMVALLGLPDRGIKNGDERGQASLVAARAPMVLVEPFFGDNPKDCRAMGEVGINRYAETLVDAAIAAFI